MEVGALALVLLAQALLFVRGFGVPPDYDESVYLAEVDAWRHGDELGTDIFVAQPPGFYVVLRAGQWAFGDTVDGGRATIVLLALVGAVAAYVLGRALVGPAAGIGAAALLGIAPSYATFASKISADLPGLALGLAGLALVALGRDPRLLVPAGALFALAVSVKLSALTLVVPLAALLLRQPTGSRALPWLAGGAAAASAVLLGPFADDLSGLWGGVVAYHDAARAVPGDGVAENVERLLRLLEPRTPFGWLVPLGLLATVLPRPRLAALWPLWAWAPAGAVFLGWHRPLHDNHLVLLALALAVPAGAALGARAIAPWTRGLLAGALVLALAAGFVQESRRLARNSGPLEPEILWATRELAVRTRPDSLVAADQPIAAYLADRRIPGLLVDTAVLRFDAGYLTDSDILGTIDSREVDAVLAVRAFTQRPSLLRAFERRFPTSLRRGGATLYLR